MQDRRDTRRKRLMQTPYSSSFHALLWQDSHATQCHGSHVAHPIQSNEINAIQTNPVEFRLISSCFWGT